MPRKMRRSVTPMLIGMSRFMLLFVIFIGQIIAVTPRMNKTLKMFEPTTFPTAMSALPCSAPMKLTTISGVDVPMPTMVNPMTNSLTFNFLAMAVEPSTSQSAPITISANPPRRIRSSSPMVALAGLSMSRSMVAS